MAVMVDTKIHNIARVVDDGVDSIVKCIQFDGYYIYEIETDSHKVEYRIYDTDGRLMYQLVYRYPSRPAFAEMRESNYWLELIVSPAKQRKCYEKIIAQNFHLLVD